MVGAMAGGIFQDRWGRRRSLLAGSIISAAAVAVCFVSNIPESIGSRRGVFLLGKLVQGFSIGAIMCTTQTYMSEVLPTSLRGPVMAFFPLFALIGQLVGAVVVFTALDIPGSRSYIICFASQWPFSAILFIIAILVPETPAYLVRKNDLGDALKSQKRLDIKSVDSVAALEKIRLSIIHEEQQSASGQTRYVDCLKQGDLRRTLIVIFAFLIPQLFGLTLLANASYYLQVIGMAANTSIIFLQLGIGLGLIANIVSIWALSAIGRRPLLIWTLAISSVLWLSSGVAGCFSGPVVAWYVVSHLYLRCIC